MSSVREQRKYVKVPPPRVYHPAPRDQLTSLSMLSRFRGEYYRCPSCKYILAKEDAKISGFDSEHSLRCVRCPKCAKVITRSPDGGGIRDVITGAGYLAAGGLLSYLLFPFINIYGLQLGSFVSLYGSLKMLLRPGR